MAAIVDPLAAIIDPIQAAVRTTPDAGTINKFSVHATLAITATEAESRSVLIAEVT